MDDNNELRFGDYDDTFDNDVAREAWEERPPVDVFYRALKLQLERSRAAPYPEEAA